MLEYDFLRGFLSLSPIVVGTTVLLFSFLSLFLVAVKTKSVHTILFKNKAILIGDFVLLPLAACFIGLFYQEVKNPVPLVANPTWAQIVFVLTVIITIYSAIRFKLLSFWWLAHGIFYFMFVYLFLNFFSKGIFQLLFGENQNSLFIWIIFIAVVICVVAQQVLGRIYTKHFPL